MYCPHCSTRLVLIEARQTRPKQVAEQPLKDFSFPKTWEKYAGERISDIWEEDPFYLIGLLDNKKFGGKLREAVEIYAGK